MYLIKPCTQLFLSKFQQIEDIFYLAQPKRRIFVYNSGHHIAVVSQCFISTMVPDRNSHPQFDNSFSVKTVIASLLGILKENKHYSSCRIVTPILSHDTQPFACLQTRIIMVGHDGRVVLT